MIRVAVLMGGTSAEHEVSLRSGQAVMEHLDRWRYEPQAVVISREGQFPFPLEGLRAFDVCFLALHGPNGEDGTLQGMLEVLGVPYTGSGIMASALGMDKVRTGLLWAHHGLPTVPRRVARTLEEARAAAKAFGYPVFLKPPAQGSSVGTHLLRGPEDLGEAFADTLAYDGVAVIEPRIDGLELTAGILGSGEALEALPLVEIVPKKDFFDYEAKYTPGVTDEICPARLPPEVTLQAQGLAKAAYRISGCRSFGRVDMFLAPSGGLLLNEINTIPGLTPNSLLPKEAAAAGMSFGELCRRILEDALRPQRPDYLPPPAPDSERRAPPAPSASCERKVPGTDLR